MRDGLLTPVFCLLTSAFCFSQSQLFNVANLNNVRYADGFAGADAGAKIAAAMADLPSTGGKVSACGFQGAQTIATDVFSTVTKPITLVVCAAQFTFSVNTTIPANFTLVFNQGAEFIAAASTTLTVNASIRAPDAQIFSGTVLLGSLNAQANVKWFGAKGDGSTNDTAAITQAISALSNAGGGSAGGGTLYFPFGAYSVSTLTMNVGHMNVVCASQNFGSQGTVLLENSTGPVFNITQSQVTVKNCGIQRLSGNVSSITSMVTIASGEALLDTDYINGASSGGEEVLISSGTRAQIRHCIFNQAGAGFAETAISIPAAGPTAMRIEDNEFTSYTNAIVGSLDGATIIGNVFSGTPSGTPAAVKPTFGTGIIFIGNWVEYAATSYAIDFANT